MAYLVFARKWRPQVFEDVVGQEHITDTLKRAIEKDRVAHAYIFSGTRGVGKTTTARILAKALNCEKGPTPTPCGTCESCKSVTSGNSFDVMEIDGASNNGVDHIRDLRENIGYTSMGGKYRIVIIDEVHMLSNAAFNALLKTLEEPPEKVIFILATTKPNKILDTIHSRCQRFDFRPISAEHIRGQLVKICTKEQIVYDDKSLELVAEKADGSMRDALSLLDQVYSSCNEDLSEEQVRSVLGLVDTHVYHAIMDSVQTGSFAAVLATLQETLRKGYDIEEFLRGLLDYLRTLLFLAIPGGVSSLADTLEPQYREVSSRFSEGDLLRFSEMATEAEKELRYSSIPRFVIERLLVKMAFMDQTVTVEQLMGIASRGGGGPVANMSTPTPLQPAPSTPELIEPPTISDPVVHMPPIVPESTPQDRVAESLPVIEEPVPPMATVSVTAPSQPLEEVTRVPVSAQEVGETPPSVPEKALPISSQTIKDPVVLWKEFLKELETRRQMLAVQLQKGTPSAHENTLVLTLPFGSDFIQEQLELDKNTIEEELATFSESTWLFSVLCAAKSTESVQQEEKEVALEKEKPIVEKPRVPPNLEEDIRNEPIIQKVIDVFNGEVIS